MSTTTNVDVGSTWVELIATSAGATNAAIGNASGARMELYVSSVAPQPEDFGSTIRSFDTKELPVFSGGVWARCPDLIDGAVVVAVVVVY